MDHLRTLSIGTTSVSSFVISIITQSNVAWTIGILAGLATIISGYFSYRQHVRSEAEHKVTMEKLKAELDAEKLKAEYYRRSTE